MGKYSWSEAIATENFKLFAENANDRAPWERDALRFDDFRYGSHFSQAEEKELLAFRQAPLPISITTAICDTAEALMTAAKPTIRVAPIINPFDENLSEIYRKVAQRYQFLTSKSWYDSLGNLQYDRVVRDYTNVGVGYFYIVPRMEYGEFYVDAKHINWRYVYPNGMAKDPFLEDMDNCIIAMKVSKEAGFKYVKAIERDLTKKQFEDEWCRGANSIAAKVEPRLRYAITSTSKNPSLWFLTRLVLEESISYVIVPKKLPENNKGYIGESVVKVVSELTPALEEAARNGEIDIREDRDFFLTEYISIGNMGFKKQYNLRKPNLVPLYYDHRDNPYPYGRVWYLYPLQRALNKFIMVALLNGSLMNSLRILHESGSIKDKDEFQKNFAKMGAMIEWERVIPGVSEAPIIIEPKPLGDAWLQMPRYIAYIMEYISGIFGAMMGDSRESPDIFSTVASLQSAGGQKIKRRLGQADATLSKVGERIGEFYKEYAPHNQFATIIDENGEQSKPMLYNVIRKKKGSDTELEIDPETDLSYGFKNIRFTTQSSNGFESGTEAALLTNMATQLSVPQLIPLILKRLNIPDVDKVMGEINLVNQQGATIEQMQKTIKELEQRTKILANQVTQKSIENVVSDTRAKLAPVVAELKSQASNNGADNG